MSSGKDKNRIKELNKNLIRARKHRDEAKEIAEVAVERANCLSLENEGLVEENETLLKVNSARDSLSEGMDKIILKVTDISSDVWRVSKEQRNKMDKDKRTIQKLRERNLQLEDTKDVFLERANTAEFSYKESTEKIEVQVKEIKSLNCLSFDIGEERDELKKKYNSLKKEKMQLAEVQDIIIEGITKLQPEAAKQASKASPVSLAAHIVKLCAARTLNVVTAQKEVEDLKEQLEGKTKT